MRRLRMACLLAVGGALVAAAPLSATHDPQHAAAGNWRMSFTDNTPGRAPTGTLHLRSVDKTEADSTAATIPVWGTWAFGECGSGATQFVVGTFQRDTDSGPVVGCISQGPSGLFYAVFKSTQYNTVGGLAGTLGGVMTSGLFPSLPSQTFNTTFIGHFPGDGSSEAHIVWPPLPDALISLPLVSNGCGGGKAGEYGIQQRLGNVSTYYNSDNPLGTRYTVSFKRACDQHDAGYSGAKVHDPINGGVVDYFTWTQLRVDRKFLADMRTLCDEQIPASAPVARRDCKGGGGYTSLGAMTRYQFVRSQGYRFFRERPKLSGSWSGGTVGDLVMTQKVRYVRATWEQGDVTGELRGTLISRDQDSLVEGFSRTSADSGFSHIKIVVDPDTPNVIEISGGAINGTFTRR